jgi:hypothetical protein
MTMSRTDRVARPWAAGGSLFAAMMLVIIGCFQVLMGIEAIAKDKFFVVTPNYVYDLDTTAWGWIHLGIGALAILTGVFLFGDATWARLLGIVIVSLSAIANFFFIPYYPLWSLLIIAMDIYVIWALASRRVAADSAEGAMYMGTRTGDVTDTGARWTATNPAEGRAMSDRQTTARAADTAEGAQQRSSASAGTQPPANPPQG